MAMKVAPQSSFLTELVHDPKTEVLTVKIGDRTYQYEGVSRSKFYRMRKAKSMGSFYARLIKGRHNRVQSPHAAAA